MPNWSNPVKFSWSWIRDNEEHARMEFELKGKVAVVTGAASGFGSAIARALVAEGCIVYLADINLAAAEQLKLGLGEPAKAIRIDVGSAADVEAGMKQIESEQGCIDILVNNAGILKVGTVLDSSYEDWDQVCRVNLSGVYYCCKAVLPVMVKKKSGKIINIASISAFKGGGVFGNVLYGTTKAGVAALTRGLARELGSHGINVNGIHPGLADTGMTNQHLNQSNRARMSEVIPLGRLASTADIAGLVTFLASSLSEYITGEMITIDGGLTTR
jgi:NAD(P)-dependent dehydrogenase (short-subunit alcohol dehydrogenase family)